MALKITYFVHGTTTDNEKRIASGHNDVGLSGLGEKQSIELRRLVKNRKFDAVFCSDLRRAVDSAELAFGDFFEIIEDKRLREVDYGDLTRAKEEEVDYSEHINKKFPNGESLKDVETRIKRFLEFLRKNYDGKHIAIVAHKASQLALDVLLKGKTWEQAIEEDWRKTKAWKPGWEYVLE